MRQQKISKLLSYVLRHRPDHLQLQLDAQGWVPVDDLLEALCKNGTPMTKIQLAQLVADNDKQRFTFDEAQQKIRANQGHSITIDLDLPPQVPPTHLYHGTAQRHLSSIQTKGLIKGNRHHVHLSAEVQTAHKVGQRHGKPVVLQVDAARMHQAGHVFFCSDNGVWLTDQVPTDYLIFPA